VPSSCTRERRHERHPKSGDIVSRRRTRGQGCTVSSGAVAREPPT
jgi:hypothetical protein